MLRDVPVIKDPEANKTKCLHLGGLHVLGHGGRFRD